METELKWMFEGRVLVVDEDPLMRLLMESVLYEHFTGVAEAENGQEAFMGLEKGDFELVLTEINMPIKEGSELVQALDRGGYNIPVVLVTGDRRMADLLSIDTRVADIVLKPFTMEALQTAVRLVCEQHAPASLRYNVAC